MCTGQATRSAKEDALQLGERPPVMQLFRDGLGAVHAKVIEVKTGVRGAVWTVPVSIVNEIQSRSVKLHTLAP